MHFPTTRIVGINVCGFRLTDGSEERCRSSFDARDKEPLGGISRAGNLDFDYHESRWKIRMLIPAGYPHDTRKGQGRICVNSNKSRQYRFEASTTRRSA